MPEVNGKLFIEIEMPAPISAISALMRVCGEYWPTASVDLHHRGGWKLTLTPADLKVAEHG